MAMQSKLNLSRSPIEIPDRAYLVLTCLGLGVLILGYGIGGFCLTACKASPLVWHLTGLVMLYLTYTGQAGILLSNLWFVGLVIFFTLAQPWPVVFFTWLPFNQAQIWAATLLAIWLLSIVLVLLLAFMTDFLHDRGWPHWPHLVGLGGLAWLAMGSGSLIYQTLTH